MILIFIKNTKLYYYDFQSFIVLYRELLYLTKTVTWNKIIQFCTESSLNQCAERTQTKIYNS